MSEIYHSKQIVLTLFKNPNTSVNIFARLMFEALLGNNNLEAFHLVQKAYEWGLNESVL